MSGEMKKAFEMKWHIGNIKPWLQLKEDFLYSPPFLVEPMKNTRWKLRMSRKWGLSDNYTSLALQRYEDDYPEMITLNYQLSFLTHDGSSQKSKSFSTKFAQKTVGQELTVTGVEIFEDKKDIYLPEGVLTLCCKLWMPGSTTSNERKCYIHSVIGRKCVTLNGTIDYFSRLGVDSNVTLNFISSSSEISFVSFDVSRQQKRFMLFERKEVECKCFSSYSCKLFALNAARQRTECVSSICLASLLTPHKPCVFEINYMYGTFNSHEYLKNDTLTFQLEIQYCPGIEAVRIEYDDSKGNKLGDESVDPECENASKSKEEHPRPLDFEHISEHEGENRYCQEDEYSSEEECFYTAAEYNLTSTTLKNDLASLYNDALFCDTKIQTSTETFPAHRNILSARSPVFKKMFTSDMKEKAGECINVPDISADTMRQMLQYLYTDSTGDLKMQSAKDLYIASDKYDIASLKERCSSFIKKNLCPANVCNILVLADMHQDKNLLSAAQEYVLTNDEEVFNSDEWKLFMKNYGGLAAQVMYLKLTKK